MGTVWRSLIERIGWRGLLAISVVLAVGEHFAWAIAKGLQATTAMGEMQNVAIAIATKSEIADAYRVGQGPTAHVMPLTPLLAGTIYRLFGPLSTTSELILVGWATALAIGSFVVGYLAFRSLGSSRIACRMALILLLIFPFNLSLEAGWFRIWEGSLAALLALIFLAVLLRYDAKRDFRPGPTLIVAFVAALLMFVNPPLGAPAYICAMLCMVTRQPRQIWWRTAALAALALAVVFTPWIVRNEQVFGHFVPLRDNFGIEYAIGMDLKSLPPADELTAFRNRIELIHPMHSEAAYANMARLGEYGYSKDWARRTTSSVTEHPREAAYLLLRHFKSFFFPPKWQWIERSREGWTTFIQRNLHNAIAGLAIIGGVFGLTYRGDRWRYVAIMMFMPSLIYMLTVTQIRYSYVIFVLEVYLASDLLVNAAGRFWSYIHSRTPSRSARMIDSKPV